MDRSPSDLAVALAEAARTISQPESLEETLDSIVNATRASVPGFDHVGISISHRNGKVETKAATGQLVWELDALQYELGEGPCVDTLRGETVVAAPRLREDRRWPRFAPGAVEAGVKSQLAVRLFTNEETLGGLNLYSTISESIEPHAEHAAELFATHAALALGHAREVTQLAEAIASRQTIGVAVGLVMSRFRLDRDRAFHYLVRASSTSNIKLRDIAQEVVDSAEDHFQDGSA
jgi:GAF domain-containing protein